MTSTPASSFAAAEFAKLRAITATLSAEWFPAYRGVHPGDLPGTAFTVLELDALVTAIAERQQRQFDDV